MQSVSELGVAQRDQGHRQMMTMNRQPQGCI
jgi:hypothetical protein